MSITPPLPTDAPPPVTPPAPSYRALKLWQRAVDVATEIHRLTAPLTTGEHATLAAELRRTAVAIPAHVASGSSHFDRTEYQRALSAAQSSLARLDTLLTLGERLTLLAPADSATLTTATADVGRLLRGLARAIAPRAPQPSQATTATPTEAAPALLSPTPSAPTPSAPTPSAPTPSAPPSLTRRSAGTRTPRSRAPSAGT